VEVVELDSTATFTAARARNAGFERLLEILPEVEFVQFVDGDCEVVEGWIDAAMSEARRSRDVAVVCGRRRERFPEASIYNQLMDMEWDTPVGEAKYCGGDALIRVNAFQHVGGYDAAMIAGEEPELCLRLRKEGFRILRIDSEMTLHDAAITHFSQWWKRSMRTGYSYTLGTAMHGFSTEAHWLRESSSIAFWGAALPAVMIGLAWQTQGRSFWLAALYVVSLARAAMDRWRRGKGASTALLYATFCTISKFPQLVGQLQYVWYRMRGRSRRVIEYK
jgi:GT2 family glycosyltransferase